MSVDVSAFSRSEVTAAILAGGQGTRVDGQDKGLLLLGGKPLVARVAERLLAQAGTTLICANRNDDRYAAYGRVVSDLSPGFRGPLAGIAAALAACRTDWLLTAPVDCPCPPQDLVARLRQAAVAAAAAAAVVHSGKRREPLFAIYHATACASVSSALQRDLAVWRWQDELGAVEVAFSDHAEDFRNLNTMDELKLWERDHGG